MLSAVLETIFSHIYEINNWSLSFLGKEFITLNLVSWSTVEGQRATAKVAISTEIKCLLSHYQFYESLHIFLKGQQKVSFS